MKALVNTKAQTHCHDLACLLHCEALLHSSHTHLAPGSLVLISALTGHSSPQGVPRHLVWAHLSPAHIPHQGPAERAARGSTGTEDLL
jgi:hypothetical protein